MQAAKTPARLRGGQATAPISSRIKFKSCLTFRASQNCRSRLHSALVETGQVSVPHGVPVPSLGHLNTTFVTQRPRGCPASLWHNFPWTPHIVPLPCAPPAPGPHATPSTSSRMLASKFHGRLGPSWAAESLRVTEHMASPSSYLWCLGRSPWLLPLHWRHMDSKTTASLGFGRALQSPRGVCTHVSPHL